jgi:hypothetical protein
VRAVLLRALAKDKHERFPNVMAFSTALEVAASADAAPLADTLASKRSALNASGPAAAPASKRRLVLAAALAPLALLAWVGVRSHSAPLEADPRAGVAPVGEARPQPETPRPALLVPALPAPTRPEIETSTAPPRPRATSAKATRRPARESASAAAPRPESSPAKTSACDPNFYFDDQGNKHFKPECFLNQPVRP